MKTLLGTRKYLLVIPVLLACGLMISYGQKKEKGSTNDSGWVEKGFVLHPTVKLSPKDENDLITKLGKFDKSLYRLEKISNGKVDTWGEMKLYQELEAESANSKAKGMSVYGVNFVPGPGPAGAANASLLKGEGKKLIEAISPILSKYQ